jgi:hypothetical protein
MKSLQHVLWRGALALSLMAVGIGSGLGMPSVERTASPGDCPIETRILVADELPAIPTGNGTTLVVLRRPLTPAG